MILRKWVAVAACLVSLAGAACAQPHGDGQKGDGQQQNTQPEHAKPGSTQPSVSGSATQPQASDHRPAESEIYEPDCRKPKGQPDADLCTQRRVADAAEKALQYALAQTVVGALGVAFVMVTLGFTARANKAAAIAAQAAMDAVGAERAWIFPDNFPTGFSENAGVDGVMRGKTFMVAVSWKNGGRSPAIKAGAHIAKKVGRPGAGVPIFEEPSSDRAGIVGPDHSVQSGWVAIYGDDLERFMRGDLAIFVYSRFTYSTTFAPDQKYYSDVCVCMICNGKMLDDSGFDRPNIETQIVGPQNIAI